MVAGTATERPVERAVGHADGIFIDGGDASLHQACRIELPVFVALCTEPLAIDIAILIGETNSDAVSGMGPDFHDEPIIEFERPFAGKEGFDLLASADASRAATPLTAGRVGKRNTPGIAAVSGICGQTRFLCSGLTREGGNGWAAHKACPLSRAFSASSWAMHALG